jgi:hypothetical protein
LGIAGFLTGAHVIVGAVAVLVTLTATDRGIHATGSRITGIYGAPVTVITGDGISGFTVSIHTVVVCCAHTPIFTGRGVVNIQATR